MRESLFCSQTPALAQFHPEPRREVRRAFQTQDTEKAFFEKRTEPGSANHGGIFFVATATLIAFAHGRASA